MLSRCDAFSTTSLAEFSIYFFFMFRHMKEIAELQTQQKNEIEALYIRLGKPLPPNLGFLHSAPPSGRRRRTSKNKLKGGKLLNPLVQQLRSGTSGTSRYTQLLSICLLLVSGVVPLCDCTHCRKGTLILIGFNTMTQVCVLRAGFEAGHPLGQAYYSWPCRLLCIGYNAWRRKNIPLSFGVQPGYIFSSFLQMQFIDVCIHFLGAVTRY